MKEIIDNLETKENADIILKVREAQIQQLYRQTWVGLSGSFLVALTVCAVLWQVVPHWKLSLWVGVLVLLTIARGSLTVAFQKKILSGYTIFQWAKLHVIGATVAALMWGLPSFLLWPSHSPVHQMVWPICIVAISAASVAMYCTWTPSYVSFLILSLGPISLRLFFEGGLVYIALGFLGLILTAVLAQTGKLMHSASLRAYVASIRNEALSSFLSKEKAKAEEFNELLKQEIKERERSQKELQLRNQELNRLNEQLTATKNNFENANIKLNLALNNVKQLSGMLPICASCKKIRNDKGYWEQIEAYIRDHSEAEFSHSICPECSKKLYPDFVKKT